MKKVFMGLISFGCGVLLLTGCGSSNKVVCSLSTTDEDAEITADIIATIEDDKVKGVSAKMVFDTEANASTFYGFLTIAQQYSEEKINLDAKLDGKTISIGDYSYMIEQEANEEDGIEEIKVIGKSKQSFIDLMESQNYKCK